MGIADDLYTGILTSGEATHVLLRDRTDPWFAALGRRVFHLGPERDRNVYRRRCDARRSVAEPADADFVLNTGPDDRTQPDRGRRLRGRCCTRAARPGCRWSAPTPTWR